MGASSLANVARYLPEQAERMPTASAVQVPVFGGGCANYTFRDLEGLSNAAVVYLKARGVSRGTTVLLMVKPGFDLICLTFALFKMGAVPVVIDPGMGVRAFLGCVRRVKPEALVGIPLAVGLSRLFPSTFDALRSRVCVRKDAFLAELRRISSQGMGEVDAFLEKTRARDLAAILFTSGSTGAPKGVCYEHGMFEAQLRLIRDEYNIEPGEVDLPMLPIFSLFNPALGVATVVPQMNPSRPAKVNPRYIIDAIERCKVTTTFGSPAIWAKVSRYCEEHGVVLSGVKRVLMAGAPVPPCVLRSMEAIVPNGVIHTPYGATEALPVSTISSREVLGETYALTEMGRGTCVGKLFSEVSVKIIKPEDGPIDRVDLCKECKPGDIGEMLVTGPSVTRAYYHEPEKTRLAKVEDNESALWHRMGDLGYKDEAGRIFFCGRKAELVVANGDTFYTDCCEGVFNPHPWVYRSALIALNVGKGVLPALVVEPEKWRYAVFHKKQLLEELRALGAAHKHTQAIKYIFFQRYLPVDVRHNAKIHRLKLGQVWSRKVQRTKRLLRD